MSHRVWSRSSFLSAARIEPSHLVIIWRIWLRYTADKHEMDILEKVNTVPIVWPGWQAESCREVARLSEYVLLRLVQVQSLRGPLPSRTLTGRTLSAGIMYVLLKSCCSREVWNGN